MKETRNDLRNIAIIAHVDHGKTTLVDCMLRQSGQFRDAQLTGQQILDSNDLERERGITILAKNIAIPYKGVKINIIDTPGHADFGGEVERVLRMADGCLVLVDAAEGPMPQTRFVLGKALEVGLEPIVVVNKIDRKDARPHEVVNEMFDLFLQLGASDEAADFPYMFASTKEGFAVKDPKEAEEPAVAASGALNILPLMDLILEKIPAPVVELDLPLQMLVTTIAWSEFVGRIAVGKVNAGTIRKGMNIVMMQKDGKQTPGKVAQLYTFDNLGRTEVHEVDAGDIVAVVGLTDIEIGDTVCSPSNPAALPRIHVDEPTLRMTFGINNSPLGGREGKFVTSRHLRDRLVRELEKNVALRVEPIDGTEQYSVSGRGVLHLSVLIETMRREGYELSIGKPEVIFRSNNGVIEEPFELLVIEVPETQTGPVIEMTSARRGILQEMNNRNDIVIMKFSIPARGLIGLRTRMLMATQGNAVITHRFEGYKPKEDSIPARPNGVLVSMVPGRANSYALDSLQARSEPFVEPGETVYEGMIVGENARNEDMDVNPTKEKKLTNMRASGSDKNIILKPARKFTLEEALEFIEADELVEVTPSMIRLRKTVLKEVDRRKLNRAKNSG
ncbi:MAG: translational GTPase TypA [Planctomycetaceae bacterium]|jgi:GTP-binding protein|nr:translational GTPase TypA [Planctomycetaceae bacterium]